MKKWKIISSALAFDNKWFKVQKEVVQLPNGKIIDDYYLWKSGNVSLVVAFTSEKKLVLVKQYKHAAREVMVECPAGFINENEDPKMAAQREFLEETGYKGKEISLLGILAPHPTKELGKLNIFLTLDVKKIQEPKFDENEEIETFEVSISEALKMIYSGRIYSSGTIAGIFIALNKLGYKFN